MEDRLSRLYEAYIEELAGIALSNPCDYEPEIKIGDKIKALELLGKQLSSERTKQGGAPVVIYGGDQIAE